MSDEQSAAEKYVTDRLEALIPRLGTPLTRVEHSPTRHEPLDIAIPIYNNPEAVKECLDSLLPTLSDGDRVWLFDDGSDDPLIAPLLKDFVQKWSQTRLVSSETNSGFVATANRAMRSTSGDLVLLNSDARVLPGWLEHLQEVMAANPRAGIVCPLSDRASLLTVISSGDEAAAKRASRVSTGPVLLPTAVGFCMLIARELINQAGWFEPIFAPGYGEENDLSMRAMKLGFEIQVADRAVVFHRGGGSFDHATSQQLQSRHQAILDQRWPEYRELVQLWWRDNPLREKIEHLCNAENDKSRVLHVLHRQYQIGGTERVTRGLIEKLSGTFQQTLVYPGRTSNQWCDFEQRPSELCRELMLNNRWLKPVTRLAGHGADLSCAHSEQALARVIRGSEASIVHFHHLLHWDSLLLPAIASALGARVVISVHDFFFNCPIHNQLEYDLAQPCGRPYVKGDDRCSACLRCYSGSQEIAGGAEVYAVGRQSVLREILCLADAVVVPSHFIRAKIMQAFDLTDESRLHVIPHGTDLPDRIERRDISSDLRIGYFGGDQLLKGAGLVVQLAAHFEDRNVQFRIYGRIKGFRRDQLPRNVVLCGFYDPGEVGTAMAEIDLAVIPSHYEESFSLIASECWAHGIPVLASKRGALSERVVENINGWLVPDLNIDSWLEAIESVMKQSRIEKVRERLKTMKMQSTERNAEKYRDLYLDIMAADRGSARRPNLVQMPSAFEHRLRRLRSRHIRHDAHWYRNPPIRNGSSAARCLGIVRDHWGTAHYRVRFPLQALAESGSSHEPQFHVVRDSGFSIGETLAGGAFSHVFVQPFISDEGLTMMEKLSRRAGLMVVLVIDDLWTALPPENPVGRLMPTDIRDRLLYAASLSNRIVVTTETQQRLLGLDHPSTVVIENALPERFWGQRPPKRKKTRGRLRLGWAGAPQHGQDLEFLLPVLKETNKHVDWVFMGMCPDALKAHVAEIRPMVPFREFPEKLAEAGLDLAIAPLADLPFNRCKSHLKVLEYGAVRVPVIASELDPYRQCPVPLIQGCDPADWIDEINAQIQRSGQLHRLGEELRDWVMSNHMMKHRCSSWKALLE